MAAEFPTSESELGYTFRAAEGHVEDIIENRQLILAVANDESAILDSDRYGNVWAATTLPSGQQVWAQMRKGKIVTAGVNTTPRELNASTGLKKP